MKHYFARDDEMKGICFQSICCCEGWATSHIRAMLHIGVDETPEHGQQLRGVEGFTLSALIPLIF